MSLKEATTTLCFPSGPFPHPSPAEAVVNLGKPKRHYSRFTLLPCSVPSHGLRPRVKSILVTVGPLMTPNIIPSYFPLPSLTTLRPCWPLPSRQAHSVLLLNTLFPGPPCGRLLLVIHSTVPTLSLLESLPDHLSKWTSPSQHNSVPCYPV